MNKPVSHPLPTLADVAAAIEASPDLTATERRDLLSAMTRVCAFIRRSPEAVPANVRYLSRILDSFAPVALGITSKTLANVRCNLFKAIEISGLVPVRRNRRAALTRPWAAFDVAMRSTGEKPHQYFVISRFIGWCSEHRIDPKEVDDAVLAAFAAEMELTATKHSNTMVRDIARRWNVLAAGHPSLGLKPLTVPDIIRRNRRTHLDRLPGSFHQDLNRYRAVLERRDPLAEDARMKPLRPASVTSALQGLLTIANAAVEGGIDPGRILSLAVLTEVEVAKAAMKVLLGRSDGKTTGGVERARKMLLGYARHLYQDDLAKVEPLKALLRRIEPIRVGMTEKNAEFLRKTADQDVRLRLLDLPQRLFARGMRQLGTNPRNALADVQASIALEVLMLHALRRRNLVGLSWSRHIVWHPGQPAPTLLFIPGEEMKTGEAITRQIGPALADMLVSYREKVLPALLQDAPDALFCRPDGKALSDGALINRITQAVWDHVGIKMTAHQFRHLGATIILDQIPEAYELARDHLGHSSSTITQRYYSGRRTLQASRTFAAIIDQARASSKALEDPKRPPTRKVTTRPRSSSTTGAPS